MPRGGVRPGGGRPKGSKNKTTIARDVALKGVAGADPVAEAAKGLGPGFTAYDLLRAVYLNSGLPGDVRFMAALKAMPYERGKPARVTAEAQAAPTAITIATGVPRAAVNS